MTSLPAKITAVHQAFDAAGIPHAFGGALALAYCTGEPRATVDIDVNVFVQPQGAVVVLRALPRGVVWSDDDVRAAMERGQARVWWDDNPLDIFFEYHAFHEHVASRARRVPFRDGEIPVLDCTDLAVFKAVFARTTDWADIEAMCAAGAVDIAEATRWIISLLGEDSGELRRFTIASATRATTDDDTARLPDALRPTASNEERGPAR